MDFETHNYYRSYPPASFQKYPNGENCRVVYMFKNKLMSVESSRSNMVSTWFYFKFFSNYDEIIIIDLLPKEFEFLFLGYVSGDNVLFNARVLCTAKIQQNSNYYEMLINNVEGTITKLKSALGRRIGFYIKSRDFNNIQSFNEEEFNELKEIIFQLNEDEIPYELTDIENIKIEVSNKKITQNLEDYRIKIENTKSELDELKARKLVDIEKAEFNIKLQEKENMISLLQFEMEKERISGTDELEIVKQEKLEKILTDRAERENKLRFKRQQEEMELLKNDPENFKVLYPEIYVQIEKIEKGNINRKEFYTTVNNLFEKIFKI